jgi:hypothetical protein
VLKKTQHPKDVEGEGMGIPQLQIKERINTPGSFAQDPELVFVIDIAIAYVIYFGPFLFERIQLL